MAYKQDEKKRLIKQVLSYIRIGLSVKEACRQARVPYTTFRLWTDQDLDLAEEVEIAKQFLMYIAENIIADNLINAKDLNLAKWYLERVKKEKYSLNYNQPTDTTNPLFKGATIVINTSPTPEKPDNDTQHTTNSNPS